MADPVTDVFIAMAAGKAVGKIGPVAVHIAMGTLAFFSYISSLLCFVIGAIMIVIGIKFTENERDRWKKLALDISIVAGVVGAVCLLTAMGGVFLPPVIILALFGFILILFAFLILGLMTMIKNKKKPLKSIKRYARGTGVFIIVSGLILLVVAITTSVANHSKAVKAIIQVGTATASSFAGNPEAGIETAIKSGLGKTAINEGMNGFNALNINKFDPMQLEKQAQKLQDQVRDLQIQQQALQVQIQAQQQAQQILKPQPYHNIYPTENSTAQQTQQYPQYNIYQPQTPVITPTTASPFNKESLMKAAAMGLTYAPLLMDPEHKKLADIAASAGQAHLQGAPIANVFMHGLDAYQTIKNSPNPQK